MCFKGGGNGYGFWLIGSSDNLIAQSSASSFRSNLNVQTMSSHGNVFFESVSCFLPYYAFVNK